MLNLERYDRQIKLQGFGIEAQEKLASAKVLVIGAGGLGCPVLQYLVAAGVGNIGIVDDDQVSLSNLHRQILYTSNDIGKLKTEAAFERLKAMNPDVNIKIISEQITTENAFEIILNYDFIIDCTDAAFIFVNSVAGLGGMFTKEIAFTNDMWMYIVCAFAGGLLGSYLASKKLNQNGLKYVLAVVLLMASYKLISSTI